MTYSGGCQCGAVRYTISSDPVLAYCCGDEKPCAFCPDCGTRIYHGSPDAQDILSVKGGSLDDIGSLSPIAHIWTRSAQLWVLRLLADAECYETVPDSFDDLVVRFREEAGRR